MTSPSHARPNLTHGPFPRAVWFLVALAATGILIAELVAGRVTEGVEGPLPAHLVRAAAVTLTTLYAGALASRAGGRPVVSAAVGLGLGLAAQLSREPVLLAGVSVATAVLAGILAVLETVPATGVLQAVREVVVATVVAGVGALAVAAYGTSTDPVRFRYLALVAAGLGVVALVSGLGAGLHGLGRRGALVLAAGTLLLVAVVLYGEALGRWGTPGLVHGVAQVRSTIRGHLHAVPHPIQALLGFPALTWGVFVRARRRQGWWVCVFGVAATVSTACALVGPAGSLTHVLLGSGYSLVVGIVVGCLVIRPDLFLTGPRGHRTRRAEQAVAHRPEPGRTRSLR